MSAFALPPIALAIGGLDPAWPELARLGPLHTGAGLQELFGAVSRLGVRHVQLDATHAAMRPRDLDRSARRGLAAILRRLELTCVGLDVFVPPEHFLSALTVDRAVGAVTGAIELAAELASLSGGAVVARRVEGDACVSVTLPGAASADVLGTIAASAERHGVRVADHAVPIVERVAGGPIGVGLDAAGCFVAGLDPVGLASSLGARLVSARVSDVSRSLGATRVVPGSGQGARGGRLDVLAYRVGLMTSGFSRAAVLDLRGLAPVAGGLAGVWSGLSDAG